MLKLTRGMTFVISLLMMPFAAMAAETSPISIAGATSISAQEAGDLFDEGVLFVDVRKLSDFEAGRIPGAIHLDSKTDFTEANLVETVGKDDPVVIYCNGENCMRSSGASAQAVSWGYTNVYYFRDGYPSWDNAGFPIE